MTAELHALAESLVESNLAHGLSTRPTDFENATQAALSVYDAHGQPRPKISLRVQSPFAATLGCLLLERVAYKLPSPSPSHDTYIRLLDEAVNELILHIKEVPPRTARAIIDDVASQIRQQVLATERVPWLPLPFSRLSHLKLSTSMGGDLGLVEWRSRNETLRGALHRKLFRRSSRAIGFQRQQSANTAVGNRVSNVIEGIERSIDFRVEACLPVSNPMLHVRFGGAGIVDHIATTQWACNEAVDLGRPRHPELFHAVRRLAHECGRIHWSSESTVISDHPMEIHLDDRRRLHRLDGPALVYRDGWSVYAIHGVAVPPEIVENPSTITVDRIDSESNVEIRRVLIERYGIRRYMLDAGAGLRHRDATGMLYCRDIAGDEPIVMVRVLNATPEPGGSLSRDEAMAIFGNAAQAALHAPADARFKEYMIRVPPWMTKAHEAVAWTFGLTGEDYHPLLET